MVIRVLLTFWYTAMALLGPSACCCSLQNAVAGCSSILHQSDPTKTRPSCCSGNADHGCSPGQTPTNNHSPKDCPCKHEKTAQIPPHLDSPSGAKVIGELREVDLSQCTSNLISAFDLLSIPATENLLDRLLLTGKRCGRDVLTAFHILRC